MFVSKRSKFYKTQGIVFYDEFCRSFKNLNLVLIKAYIETMTITEKITERLSKNNQLTLKNCKWRKYFKSLFFTTEKNYSYHLKIRRYCYSKWKQYFFQIWKTHFAESAGDNFSCDFFGKDTLRKKTSALVNSKN